MNCLVAYDWPGNVRELEMTVQRALAFSSSSMIEPSDLMHVPRGPHQEKSTGELQSSQELEVERQALTEALREASGDKLAAAKLLGINESTLGRRLKYHRLDSLL